MPVIRAAVIAADVLTNRNHGVCQLNCGINVLHKKHRIAPGVSETTVRPGDLLLMMPVQSRAQCVALLTSRSCGKLLVAGTKISV